MSEVETIIGVAISVAAAALLEALLLRSRRLKARKDIDSDELILEYGGGWRILMIVGSLLMPVIFLIVITVQSRGFQDMGAISELEESWPVFVLSMLIPSGLFIPGAIETFSVAHRITKVGIKKHTPWTKDFYITWGEIDSITYDNFNKWFVIKCYLGTLRLSVFLNGIGDFAQAVEEKVPRPKWEKVRDLIHLVGSGGSLGWL